MTSKMGIYDRDIELLLGKEPKSPSGDQYFLSVYLSTRSVTTKTVQQQLLSQIREAFKKHKAASKNKKAKEKLLNVVQDHLEKLDTLERGIALFVEILPGKVGYTKILLIDHYPKNEYSINSVFDLDQLVAINSRYHEAIVVQIAKDETVLYSYDTGGIEEIDRVHNQYGTDRTPHYAERYSPTRGQSLVHGTGAKKTERAKEEARKRYVNELVIPLINNHTKNQLPDYILILCTVAFTDISEGLVNDISKRFPKTQILSEQKNIKTKTDLREFVEKRLKKERELKRSRRLMDAERNIDQFVRGWEEVTLATRMGRISRLFINPTAKKSGYVLDRKLPYTYAVKGSRQVSNISPWVVRAVIQMDGVIHLLGEETDYPVAAELRY